MASQAPRAQPAPQVLQAPRAPSVLLDRLAMTAPTVRTACLGRRGSRGQLALPERRAQPALSDSLERTATTARTAFGASTAHAAPRGFRDYRARMVQTARIRPSRGRPARRALWDPPGPRERPA